MRINANGIDIYYELSGPEGAPVVTLSHSLMASTVMWDPQMDALADYRVLRFDTRGHGRSKAAPGAYSFEMLAEDAKALLLALGIDRTHFVGLSMGGMIGQALAIYHPELLRSLVLCDTRGHNPDTNQDMRAERIAKVEKDGVEPLVENAIARWFSDGFVEANPETIEGVRAMIRKTPKKGVIGCSHALGEHNYTPRLHEIAAPTLIIVGEEDPGTPVSDSQAMRERIPGSRLVVLPTARHLSNVERATEFNEALLGFLRGL